MPGGKPSAADVLPMRQVKSMVTFLNGAGRLRDAALVAVAAGYGLRIGDVLHMRWGDVVTAEWRIKQTVTLTEEKTRTRRTLHTFPFVAKTLERWLEDCGAVDHDEWVFPGGNGAPLTRQTAWRLLRRTAQTMGIKAHVSPHSLRKAFCDYVYEHTRDAVMTCRITGHSNPAQLLRYIGRIPEAEEEIWSRMTQGLKRMRM